MVAIEMSFAQNKSEHENSVGEECLLSVRVGGGGDSIGVAAAGLGRSGSRFRVTGLHAGIVPG